MTDFIGEVKMTVFIVSEVKMTGFTGPEFEVKVTGLGPCFEGMGTAVGERVQRRTIFNVVIQNAETARERRRKG